MRTQRGVAAITAILIVAVAATAAAMMLSQQSAMIDQAMMVAARAQSDQYAQAGLDWARGVLSEDSRRAPNVDTPAEGWAQPIAALPVDRALVAGAIADEQAKFNLNNIVNQGNPSAADMKVLRALLARLQLPEELAEAVLDWIDADPDIGGPGGAENAHYQSLPRPYHAANRDMVQVEELYRVRGFDAKVVARLKPHVTALPAQTAINVNTADEVVLAALLGAEPEKVQALLAQRTARPFSSREDFTARARAAGIETSGLAGHDVKSGFFLVLVRVAQDEVQLATEALLKRGADHATSVEWKRPRY